MICLRCGYCCKRLSVVIVKDPDKPPSEDNLTVFNGGINPETGEFDNNTRCPHLRGDKVGEYWCVCHDKPWFKQTPCAAYQSHWPEKKCRMGVFLTSKQS